MENRLQNILKINYFELTDTKLLFFDIFYKNNKIFLIMPIYNKQADHNQIFVSINNNRLTLSEYYVKDSWEPALIYVYNYTQSTNTIDDQSLHDTDICNIVTVDIECNNIKKTYNLQHIRTTSSETKKFLAVTTLFKNDYKLFPLFYNYYKDQGVSHFYMYYNGILTQEIRQIFNIYRGVTLIEWNFHYWNIPAYKYCHHAQMGQIHHAIHRYGKDICDYMIFCDLDEYLHIPESKFEKNNKSTNTLKTFIQNNPSIEIFGFRNIWANTIDNKCPTRKLPNKIVVSNDVDIYTCRSKNIYKVSSINTVGIHDIGKNLTHLYKNITDLSMYHFYNWSKPSRHFENVNKEILLIKNILPQITNNKSDEIEIKIENEKKDNTCIVNKKKSKNNKKNKNKK